MKKLLILFILLIHLLSSCVIHKVPNQTNDVSISTEEAKRNEIEKGEFLGEVNTGMDLNENTLSYDIELDEKTALDIGDVILKKVFGEKEISISYFFVCEVKDEGYYIITRTPNYDIPGYSYHVALNKKDGKIINIWADID